MIVAAILLLYFCKKRDNKQLENKPLFIIFSPSDNNPTPPDEPTWFLSGLRFCMNSAKQEDINTSSHWMVCPVLISTFTPKSWYIS